MYIQDDNPRRSILTSFGRKWTKPEDEADAQNQDSSQLESPVYENFQHTSAEALAQPPRIHSHSNASEHRPHALCKHLSAETAKYTY